MYVLPPVLGAGSKLSPEPCRLSICPAMMRFGFRICGFACISASTVVPKRRERADHESPRWIW